MFQKLNNLPDKHKSGPNLPIYKIEDSITYSLWEYIQGEEFGEHASASSGNLEKVRNAERENLERLHCICSKVGITDLHHENVKLTGIKAVDKFQTNFIFEDQEFKWVPIDLEIVEQDHSTGLYGAIEEIDFTSRLITEREKELIEEFTQAQKQRVSRILPMPPAVFQQLTVDYQTVLEIPSQVIEALKENENCDILNENELRELISASVNKGDIPFLLGKTTIFTMKQLL